MQSYSKVLAPMIRTQQIMAVVNHGGWGVEVKRSKDKLCIKLYKRSNVYCSG